MCDLRKVIAFAATVCAAVLVPGVPGFAQSNSDYRAMVAVERTSMRVLREYNPRHVTKPLPAGIPTNLSAPATYKGLLQTMLQRSATFRRQCQRIASTPELLVTLQATRMGAAGHVRARTHIVRSAGQLLATIEMIRLDDPVELIAHELEHIIEQLDGVNLASRAAIDASGVQRGRNDRNEYETTRAKRVGLTVASEVGGGWR